jgi:hypothetical protein
MIKKMTQKLARILTLCAFLSSILALPLASFAAAGGPVYQPQVLPPIQPINPNYGFGIPGLAKDPNWGIGTSSFNALLAALVTGIPGVSINESFNVNSISGNPAVEDPYAPLENGFYINSLRFGARLKSGGVFNGYAMNEDDFHKALRVRYQDPNLTYNLRYAKILNRDVFYGFDPNPELADFSPLFGYPSGSFVAPLGAWYLPGYIQNFPYYPRLDDYIVNSLRYTENSGLGFYLSNVLRSQTGLQGYYLGSAAGDWNGMVGRDNNLSRTTVGVNYTDSLVQGYAATTSTSWDNKQVGYTEANLLAASGPAGITPSPANGFSAESEDLPTTAADTFWSENQAGLRIPFSSNYSISGYWKQWNKRSAGIFSYGTQDAISFPYVPPMLSAEQPPTNLSPQYTNEEVRGTFNFNFRQAGHGYLDYDYWDETPDSSILDAMHRKDENLIAGYDLIFGNQYLSLSGGWEHETDSQLLDYYDLRIFTAFNPLVNTALQGDQLGTAVSNGYVVTYTPNGAAGPTEVIPILISPCNSAGFPAGLAALIGCGTNTITYPVYGFVNVPPTVPGYYPVGEAGPAGGFNPFAAYNALTGMTPTGWPVGMPVGLESLSFDQYRWQAKIGGPILSGLTYRLSVLRRFANNAWLRTDPMDNWKYYGNLNYSPNSQVFMSLSYTNEADKTNSSWVYPYSDNTSTLSFNANYIPSSAFSLFAGYTNTINKEQSVSPVYDTEAVNYAVPFPTCIGAPSPTSCLPAVGSAFWVGLFEPWAQWAVTSSSVLGGVPDNLIDQVNIQDQEIYAGINWTPGKNWNLGVNYTHSRPQTFQNPYLSSPALSFVPGVGYINIPANFYNDLPNLQVMTRIDGNENDYALNVKRMLQKNASLGLTVQYNEFSNNVPDIAAECGASAPMPLPACPSGYITSPGGFNSYVYSPNLMNGHVWSESVYYSLSF